MLWAMICLCFFGFLKAGKVVATETNFDASQHLTYADIAVDNLKQSKIDLFRLEVKVWNGKTGPIFAQWQ